MKGRLFNFASLGPYLGAFRIAGIYLVLGSLWILFSDRWAAAITRDPETLTAISLIKGWGYILVTALLLYGLVRREITVLRARDEQLRFSEERYQLALRATNDGLWDWNLKTDETYYSPRWKAMLGYTDEELENNHNTLKRLIHPDDLDPVLALANNFIQGRADKYEVEFRLRHKNGFYLDILSRAFLQQDDHGEAVRLVGTHVDITERNWADYALRRSEEKYRKLFSEMLSGFALHEMIYDKDGNAADYVTLEVNNAYELILNVKSEQIVGRKASEILAVDELDHWLGIFAPVAREGKSIRYDMYSPLNQKYFEGSAYCPEAGKFALTFTDITDRVRAEQALRESAENMTMAQHVGQFGSWEMRLDNDLSILEPHYWSDECYRIFGYEPGSVEITDKFAQSCIHPDDYEPAIQVIFKAIQDHKEFTTGYRILRPDGTLRYIHEQGKIILDERTGRWVKVVGAVYDITERKQAELALQQSEQKFATAFRISPDSININRMSDGRYIEINEGFTTITGYTRQEVIGHSSAEISIWADPADRGRLVRSLQECGEVTDLEAVFRLKNGELRTGLMSARQIDLDGEAHILSITRDITGRKQAELALRDSEARFRAIFESVAVGIALVDTFTGSPIQSNAIFQEMLGYSQADLVRMSFADFTHPDDLKLEWPLYQDMIAGKRSHYQIEKRYLKKDGHILWARLNVSPVQASGDQKLLVGIIEDISQRKAAEKSLRQQMETNLRQKQELEAILEVSAAMRRADTRPEMVDLIVNQSVKVLDAQAGALALLNSTSLVIQAAVGPAADWCGMTVSQDQSLFWEVIQNGLPKFIVAELVENGEDFLRPLADASSEITAGIFTPLKSGENTIGLLFVGYNEIKGFTETQVRLALAISDMAGNALQRMSIADAVEKMVADRTRELETIYKVTVVASEETGLDIALQNALYPILESLDSQIGAILILDEKSQELYLFAEKGLPAEMKARIERRDLNNSLEHWVMVHKQLLVLNDLASDPRMSVSKAPEINIPFAAIPMVVSEKIVGILEIGRLGGKQFDLDELTLLSFVASHLGLVVENVTLLRQAEQHAVLEERSRMARELHDSVTQLLYSANLYAEGSSRLVDRGDLEGAKGKLGELSQIMQQALREMRLMVYELRSPGLHSKGLVRSIQQRLESVELRSGIQATLEHEPLPAIPERVEDALYRITLEALNNSLKHSLAKNVAVSLRRDRNKICLRVRDDGSGFILQEALESGGIGLTSMRERAERLKGSLRIQSALGQGTEIVAAIPMDDKKAGKSRLRGQSR